MASKQFGPRRENRTEQGVAGIISELKVVAMAITGGGTVEPIPGWLYCNGAAISRTTYEALFVALGTVYGPGDGSTTFNLPDYRGRGIIAAPDGQTGSTRATAATRGTVVGTETETLTSGQIPVHTHALTGGPTLSGSPALSGAIARSGAATGTLTGAPSITDPGHSHTIGGQYGSSGGNTQFGSWGGLTGLFNGSFAGVAGLGMLSATTGITSGIGTLAVNVTDGITVNNGTLAVGIGTLATSIGTLAASNAGSGGSHNNLHPAQGAGGVLIKY